MKAESADVCQESVYRKIFDQVAPLLRNYLYYKSKDKEGSEDLVQTAFVKLWENCKKVKPELAKAYLFKVATNKFLNQVEKQKVRMKFQEGVSVSQNQESPEYLLEYQEYKKKLEQAINALSDKQREVFLLNRIDKLTYAQIAENLGISVKAVEKRMHSALIHLRAKIKEL